jgi:Family of unknown function (DUF5681)
MGEYEIGYGKPPKHTRFKKGVCPNPRGRGKERDQNLGGVVLDVLAAETEYRERGQVKRGSRIELAIRRHIAAALSGDVASAALLLKIRKHAEKYGDPGPLIINLINSPDVVARRHREEAAGGRDAD